MPSSATFRLAIIRCSIPLIAAARPLRVRSTIISSPNRSTRLRAGGVVALITSRYTMDKQDATIRQYLAERANLIGAIRLPNTAFKANAGTEVTTDILFLQKHGPGVPASGEAWRELAPIDTPDGPIHVNEYFRAPPGDDAGPNAA
jgi:hypothetical protein